MRPGLQVALSGALTFGVPLLLAVRELWVLNRLASGPSPDSGPAAHAPAPPPDDDSSLPPLPPGIDLARWPEFAGLAREERIREDA